MKKILSYIICALAAVVLTGCAKEAGIDNNPDGKGCFVFNMKLNGEILTRAEAPENCVIKIANSEGVLYKYENIADIPTELWLLSGSYTVTVEGGTKVASGWNTPYYKESENFVISKGAKSVVTMDCLIQNTLFTVDFESSVTDVLTDYSVTLFPDPNDTSTTLVFDESNPAAVGYVILESGQTTIDWEFTATHSERGAVTKTGTLTALQPRKKYGLTFKYTILSQVGILEIDLKVDETLVEHIDDFVILQRPKISGVGFNLIDRQLPADSHEILVAASSDITNIALSGSVFSTPYELLDVLNTPVDYGVEVEVVDKDQINLKFMRALFNLMPAGSNHITITVTDVNGKQSVTEFSVMTSGIDAVERNSIWIRRATLKGLVLEPGVVNVRFGYREVGGAWTYTAANSEPGNWYSADLTGLVPGTDYEASMEVDGTLGETVSFTTETEFALPNGGFEEWTQLDDKDPWYPFTTAESAFWDTANGGLGNMNITSQNSDDIRDGSPGEISVKMESSTYVFKFAAGNLYTGRFDGITVKPMGANVKFGREINSRPSALKGWYKASPKIITHASSKVPGIIKGKSTDEYQIYAMLVDWTEPRTVNPGNPASLIDLSADYVIAYGEMSGSTEVSEWTEFTIPIKYRSNKAPTRIVIVACASRYGDYFVGAKGSVLQVDDFELVYDDAPIFQ